MNIEKRELDHGNGLRGANGLEEQSRIGTRIRHMRRIRVTLSIHADQVTAISHVQDRQIDIRRALFARCSSTLPSRFNRERPARIARWVNRANRFDAAHVQDKRARAHFHSSFPAHRVANGHVQRTRIRCRRFGRRRGSGRTVFRPKREDRLCLQRPPLAASRSMKTTPVPYDRSTLTNARCTNPIRICATARESLFESLIINEGYMTDVCMYVLFI